MGLVIYLEQKEKKQKEPLEDNNQECQVIPFIRSIKKNLNSSSRQEKNNRILEENNIKGSPFKGYVNWSKVFSRFSNNIEIIFHNNTKIRTFDRYSRQNIRRI